MREAKESKTRSGAVRSRTFQFSVLGLFLLVTACGLFFGFARLVGSFPLLMAALSIGLTLAMVLVALGMAKIVYLYHHPKPWCKYLELAIMLFPLVIALTSQVALFFAFGPEIAVKNMGFYGLLFFAMIPQLITWRKRWEEIAANEKIATSAPKGGPL